MASSRNTPEHETTTDDIILVGPAGVPSDINQVLTNVCRSVSVLQGNGDITVDKERSDYVKTPALEEADDILQKTGWVILCGPPGCGKTTLAYALSRCCREQGFSPYILERLELWRPSIGRDERSVVVLDGALGQVRVTSEQHDCWKQILDTLLELVKKNTCKLVITVYPHVLRELQQLERTWASPLRSKCAVVHMTQILPEHVKENLLKIHLNKLDLTTDTQRDIVQKVLQNDISGPVFPWCCNHMLKQWDHSSQDPTSIFVMPAEAYAELLKELALHHSHGPVFAAVFALSMRGLFNFLNHPLQATPHLQELGCKVYSDDKLARYADLLQGFVLSESGCGFSSRVLYEATGLALGRSFRLPILLKVCDITFLVQYVHATVVKKNTV